MEFHLRIIVVIDSQMFWKVDKDSSDVNFYTSPLAAARYGREHRFGRERTRPQTNHAVHKVCKGGHGGRPSPGVDHVIVSFCRKEVREGFAFNQSFEYINR